MSKKIIINIETFIGVDLNCLHIANYDLKSPTVYFTTKRTPMKVWRGKNPHNSVFTKIKWNQFFYLIVYNTFYNNYYEVYTINAIYFTL